MKGQRMSRFSAWNMDDGFYVTHTEQVRNRDTFAEIALVSGFVDEEDFWSIGCTIEQIVSDSGVETLREPFAFRRNVTSVTFAVNGIRSEVRSRWALNFWS